MVTQQEVETKQLKDIVDLESFLKVTDQTREDINKQLEAQRLTTVNLPIPMSIKSLTKELLEPSKSSNIPKKSSVQYDNLMLSDL